MRSLRSFIKAVKKAKTISEEKTILLNESADIRTKFRNINLKHSDRRQCILKMIFLYITGEKTFYGQIECVNLLGSQLLADKKLGYLAVMLLIEMDHEILTLLTNILIADMNSSNKCTVGLALSCLGVIATCNLARDLFSGIERIMDGEDVDLKKKAILVAGKFVEKEPDLAEYFVKKIPNLLSNTLCSIVMATMALIQSICRYAPQHTDFIFEQTPLIVKHLKIVSFRGQTNEYGLSNSNDAFFQFILISTLGMLLSKRKISPRIAIEMSDILSHIISTFDNEKNMLQTLLYESVKTIFSIESDQSLKFLGINILSKFLSLNNNNIRYVSLDVFLKIIKTEYFTVQRHKNTIISCLSDPDISIRRRALDLTFEIMNETNIVDLIDNILIFLETVNTDELKYHIISQLIAAVFVFSKNDNWIFNTLLRILITSGNFVSESAICNILDSIILCNDIKIKKVIIIKFFESSFIHQNQFALILITIWLIGEFADLILTENFILNEKKTIIDEEIIIDFLDLQKTKDFNSVTENNQVTIFLLTMAIKLSVKLVNPKTLESLRSFINSKTTSQNIEIQNRAIEYNEIFFLKNDYKKGILSLITAPNINKKNCIYFNINKNVIMSFETNDNKKHSSEYFLDFLYDNNDDKNKKLEHLTKTKNNLYQRPNTNLNMEILDLFENQSKVNKESYIEGYSDNLIKIFFRFQKKIQPGMIFVEVLTELLDLQFEMKKFDLFFAVPKTQKLTIKPISNINGGLKFPMMHQLKIVGEEGLKIRLKVKFVVNQNQLQKEFNFNQFDVQL